MGDRPLKDRSPISKMLFPRLSGLSACRNPQDLLALDALLLETTEMHHSCRFLGRKLRKNPYPTRKIFKKLFAALPFGLLANNDYLAGKTDLC